MAIYKCKNCGYMGNELIFQFNEYKYCIASNNEEPQYIKDAPFWVTEKCIGDATIGEPVGCPRCHAWGTSNFEKI